MILGFPAIQLYNKGDITISHGNLKKESKGLFLVDFLYLDIEQDISLYMLNTYIKNDPNNYNDFITSLVLSLPYKA